MNNNIFDVPKYKWDPESNRILNNFDNKKRKIEYYLKNILLISEKEILSYDFENHIIESDNNSIKLPKKLRL